MLYPHRISSWHIFGATRVVVQTTLYPSAIFHPHSLGSGRTGSFNSDWVQQCFLDTQLYWHETWRPASKLGGSSSGNRPFLENRSFLHSLCLCMCFFDRKARRRISQESGKLYLRFLVKGKQRCSLAHRLTCDTASMYSMLSSFLVLQKAYLIASSQCMK